MWIGFPTSSKRRPAFVLLSVLLIVSLLLSTVSVYALYARQEVKKARVREFEFVARSVAQTALRSAAEWITEDQEEYTSTKQTLYSGKKRILSFGEQKVEMVITPLDDKIPIAHLFLPDGVTLKNEYRWGWEQVWQRLELPHLANLLLDFMDKDDVPRVGSREDEHYINRPPQDLSELLRLKEVTQQLLYGGKDILLPLDALFTVFSGSQININLAQPQALLFLDKEITAEVVESLLAYRTESAIKDRTELSKIPGFPAAAVTRIENVIGFKSVYFQIDIKVSGVDEQRKYTVIVLKKGKEGCDVVRWEG